MTTKDATFQLAKKIKSGTTQLNGEWKELKSYVHENWSVQLLAGDVFQLEGWSLPPKLRLIFEDVNDIIALPTLMTERQTTIAPVFQQIVKSQPVASYEAYDLSRLHVDYFQFQELAFQECVDKIDCAQVRDEFTAFNVWIVSRFWNYLTVFYQRDEDVETYAKSGVSDRIYTRIQAIAALQDEFGYLADRSVQVHFDSKEKFDQAGGWRGYYR